MTDSKDGELSPLLRDILNGKKEVVKKHASRTGAKFRTVDGYVRRTPGQKNIENLLKMRVV